MLLHLACWLYLLTLGAHTQRGLRYLVCHPVRPSVRLSIRLCVNTFLSLHATRWPKTIPMGLVPHWFDFKNWKSAAFKSDGVKQERNADMLMSTASCLCLHTVETSKGQIVSRRLNSKATYKYPVRVRNDQLWAGGCGLYACVSTAVACMYNLVHLLGLHSSVFLSYMAQMELHSFWIIQACMDL